MSLSVAAAALLTSDVLSAAAVVVLVPDILTTAAARPLPWSCCSLVTFPNTLTVATTWPYPRQLAAIGSSPGSCSWRRHSCCCIRSPAVADSCCNMPVVLGTVRAAATRPLFPSPRQLLQHSSCYPWHPDSCCNIAPATPDTPTAVAT